MQITVKGFPETIEQLRRMNAALESQRFQQALVDALEPVERAAAANVNSITGRTVKALIVRPGKGRYMSAYLKVDPAIASVLFRGRPFRYPYVVERGHGGPHPAPPHPFFAPAVRQQSGAVKQLVKAAILDILQPFFSSSIGGEFS